MRGRQSERLTDVINRVSVVIPNYNYGRYVARAIESALRLRWHDVEVIVVDDGSTDDSRAVIAAFGERIHARFQDNRSQRVACNEGFAMSTGDVVIFLDSDDVLDPGLAAELAAVWRPGVSKVQVQMERIDQHDRPLGSSVPAYRRVPTPEQIRTWAVQTTAYPTPPGSGNAYSRWFLERVLPADESNGDAADSALLASAPLLGDVITIPKPLVKYRVHGSNDSNLLAGPERFPREVARARGRFRYARRIAGLDESNESPLFRSRELLQLRVASARLCPDAAPLPHDGPMRRLVDTLRSPFQPGPEPLSHRITVAVWCGLTLVAPAPMARRLIRLRYGRRS